MPRAVAEELEESVGDVRESEANATNNDDDETTLGSVILPCRARGMLMDHNFKVRHHEMHLHSISISLVDKHFDCILCNS